MTFTRVLVAASLVLVVAIACAAVPTGDRWTTEEIDELRSMTLGELGPVPPDPTNRFADDPRAAALGEQLFFDARLSANGQVSCATCHDPARDFQDGRPLAGATVQAGADPVETQADGRFVVDHEFELDAESYQLTSGVRATREGFTPGFEEVDFLEPGPKDVTVRLFPADVTISGRVQDAAGRPVEAVRVILGAEPRGLVAGTDSEGRFAFERCHRADEYRVWASAPGHCETVIDLPMTRSDIGDFLGLTIETVSRTFTKLRQTRIIDLPQCATVRILELARLEALANGATNE